MECKSVSEHVTETTYLIINTCKNNNEGSTTS